MSRLKSIFSRGRRKSSCQSLSRWKSSSSMGRWNSISQCLVTAGGILGEGLGLILGDAEGLTEADGE